MKRNTMNKIKAVTVIIISIIIISIFAVPYFKEKEASLRKNYKVHFATIVDIKYPLRSSDHIVYVYSVNGISYTGIYGLKDEKNRTKYKMLINKDWPIVYDSTNFENSKLLLDSDDYKGFEIDKKYIKYMNF